jgi:hypothetical protein
MCAWPTEKYKIGITKDDKSLAKRIKAIQTGNPEEITLINKFKSDNYRKVEGWLHRQYKSKRESGEWFLLEAEDVINFLDECKKADQTISLLIEQNHFYD